MLGDTVIEAILATAQPDRAKSFYQDVLGLKLVREDGFALIFAGKIGFLRLAKLPAVLPSPNAVLALQVADIAGAISHLVSRGVRMETYGFLQPPQDGTGVWHGPDGTKVAWFRDPDMNLLSVTQLP